MTPEIKNRIEKIGRGEVPKGYKKTKAGILPVDITQENNDFNITMTQGKPQVEKPLDESITSQNH